LPVLAAATVDPAGGGTGGALPPGFYYLTYTLTGGPGQSPAAPESQLFQVVAGAIPRVTLPSAPPAGFNPNFFLTPVNGAPGSELTSPNPTRVNATTFDLKLTQPAGGTAPPTTWTTNLAAGIGVEPPVGSMVAAPAAATVFTTGGGTSGGGLPAGTYYLTYTF